MAKKAQVGPFVWLKIANFLIGITITLMLLAVAFTIVWHFFGPSGKGAASKQLLDDMAYKINKFESGEQTLIVAGSLDDGKWLRWLNSNEFLTVEIDGKEVRTRPKKCGDDSNSCLCLCNDESCSDVADCRNFPREKVRSAQISYTATWMPVTTTVTSSGKFKGRTPAQENVKIISYLAAKNPSPGSGAMPPQLGRPNLQGIYSYDAPQASPLYYRYNNGAWEWSPDWVPALTIASGEGGVTLTLSLKENILSIKG